jgi:hypothetical protein
MAFSSRPSNYDSLLTADRSEPHSCVPLVKDTPSPYPQASLSPGVGTVPHQDIGFAVVQPPYLVPTVALSTDFQSRVPACYRLLEAPQIPIALLNHQRGQPLPPLLDETQTRSFLHQILEPDQITELRVIRAKVQGQYRPGTFSGFFDREHVNELIGNLARVEDAQVGCYVIPNALARDRLLDRFNRAELVEDKQCTEAKDVDRRHWLLIDIDSPRPSSKWSATDAEKTLAWELLCDIAAYLVERGLPPGIICDSGNGWHLMIPVSLPADDDGWCRRVLQHLASRFDGDGRRGHVDTKVFDPNRIWKLPGTVARKGDHVPEEGRVWRMAWMVAIGQLTEGVTPINKETVGEWESKLGIARTSEAVKPEQILQPAKVRADLPKRNQLTNVQEVLQCCRIYVEKMPAAIQGQNGSAKAFAVACTCFRFGLSEQDAASVLAEYNQRCQPQWTESELQHKLADAKRTVEEAGEFGRLAGATGISNGANVIPPSLRIRRLLQNTEENQMLAELTWQSNGRARCATVPFRILGESRSITTLRDFGLPVTSETAKSWVNHFAEILAGSSIPTVLYTDHLGWQGRADGCIFLAGPDRPIVPAGVDSATAPIFRARDAGGEQAATGFRAAGKSADWKQAMEPLANFPRAQLAVIAALATPLLEPLDAHSFVVSYAAETSLGKTTALKAAASCWGKPECGTGVMARWDATQTSLERTAGVRSGMPTIVDDTAAARQDGTSGFQRFALVTGRPIWQTE